MQTELTMERLLPTANRIAQMLRARGETIAVAESSAGGLISAALLAVPGASAYFVGGGVVYTRRALLALTPKSETVLRDVKPGTEAAALARAHLIREHLSTNWGLSESGTAGPTGSRYGYPPGHSAIAVSGSQDAAKIVNTGSDDRLANMWAFALASLELLELTLKDHPASQ
jgi:nicotinamide-nucleotide amidase